MDAPYRATSDVWVLPTSLEIPGVGTLLINAFVLMAEEPVLIDTGIGVDSPEFLDAVDSIVPLHELRWLWLTHDDADHTGSVATVMERAPQALLATHALGALRMSTWWQVPLHRVRALTLGEQLDVGDRTLRTIRPPLFDNPMSTGVFDEKTGTLFSVDAFGAILPDVTEDAAEIAEEALHAGMTAWATFDSPWAHLTDGGKFAEALRKVHDLKPSRVLSSHLPPASGDVSRFLKVLEQVPNEEPFIAPDQTAFEQMLAGMAARASVPQP